MDKLTGKVLDLVARLRQQGANRKHAVQQALNAYTLQGLARDQVFREVCRVTGSAGGKKTAMRKGAMRRAELDATRRFDQQY